MRGSRKTSYGGQAKNNPGAFIRLDAEIPHSEPIKSFTLKYNLNEKQFSKIGPKLL